MHGAPSATILVVEDENIIALDLKSTLTRLGYSVPAIAARGDEAIEQAAALRPDLVLMDIRLRGGMDGVQAAEEIRRRCDIPVIYLTAYADPSTVERARITEPYGYLLKPFDERELQVIIEMALYRHTMERRLRERERWLGAALRSIGDGVVATDGDWRIRFMNPAAEHLTGWAAECAIGHELAEVVRVSIPSSPSPLQGSEPVPRGGRAQGVLLARDGREVPVEESSTTIRDDGGNVIGVVIALRDISTRRRVAGRRAQR